MKMIRYLLLACLATTLHAKLTLPAIITDHMVLQQKQDNPIWGWDDPGTKVTVTFGGTKYRTVAGKDGRWTVRLAAAPANAQPQVLSIRSGRTRRDIQDVVIGEVWMCSGQSNMQWALTDSNTGDIEALRARSRTLRLITVPQVGTQEPQTNFDGKWEIADSATAKNFSAIGFLFGRYLEDVLQVPVGLIDNAWGGSGAEAWVPYASLAANPRFAAAIQDSAKRDADALTPAAQASYEKALAQWKADCEKARAQGAACPPKPFNWLTSHIRPGNIFGGVVSPTLGYGIKGVIWYQGESNTGRPGGERAAEDYADLFAFLIEQWRKEQGQGDFPFYWVQLANFQKRSTEPQNSAWAVVREAQTSTLRLPRTGQAVIIDLGDTEDIHPRNKYDVASRLVRWALARDYGIDVPYRSPEFQRVAFADGKATVTFDCFGSRLIAVDTKELRGFALRGDDGKWHWAKARIVAPDQVEVSSPDVPAPVAVRYAWADNPDCNLYSNARLPATPFRWEGDHPAAVKP